jgi:hypothetical protein
MKTFLHLIMFPVLLGACASPKIEKKYDTLSGREVCSLQNYLLKNAWG